jgi:hypothetical protein
LEWRVVTGRATENNKDPCHPAVDANLGSPVRLEACDRSGDRSTRCSCGADALSIVVDPEVRTVHVYRGDGSVSLLREKDELSGEHVVPGFRCPLTAIFPRRAAESQPSG